MISDKPDIWSEGGLAGAPYRTGSLAGPLQGDGQHYRIRTSWIVA